MEFLSLTSTQLLFAVAILGAAVLISDCLSRRYHPIVSTFFHQLIHYRRLYDYHTELSRRHKTFRILMGPLKSAVYTSDPALVEHVLRSNFHNYGKGKTTHGNMSDLLGDGIFAVDGVKWRHQRKLASYEFTTRSLREHTGVVFRKSAVNLAQVISDAAAAASQQPIDIQQLFIRASTDSIFEVACGIDLNSLRGFSTDEERGGFVRALDSANAQINQRFVDPFWKVMRFFNVGMEKGLRDNIRVVDDYLYKAIHSKLANMSSNAPGKPHDDLLSRFLRDGDDHMGPDLKYLRDIVLNFVVAGKDSTAGAMSWFLYTLCKYPSVQEKIAREVKQAVNGRENEGFQEFAENLTDGALENMHYLFAAINETLRLHPVIPMDPKVCFSDETLPDGFSIRKGDTITYQPYCMGRMRYIWGENAEEFRPERWLDENGHFRPENPFKFPVFQAGPRICLGKEFAYRQMKFLSAVLLRFFVFQLSSDEKETIGYKLTMTLLVDPGVYVHVSRR